MANTRIALRRTSTAAKVPNSTHISTAELGLNLTDQLLYSMDAANNVFCIGNNLPTMHVGNSTTSLLTVGNSSVNSLVVNTYISGNGFGITSVTATAAPAGANQQIQFNDSAAAGADINFTWDKTADQLTVGNATINTTVNSSSLMVGNIGSGITTTSASITVGNSTVNTAINSTAIVIGNGSVNTFVVNTYISGNGYGITSVGGAPGGANTYIQFNDSTALGGGANLTWNKTTALLSVSGFTINSTGVAIGNGAGLTSVTAAPGGANTQIQFNDSATTQGDANFTWDKTADQLTVGNATINTTVNSSSLMVGNIGTGITTTSASITVGNSTINTVTNATSLLIGAINATSTGLALTNTSLTIGNASVNTIANSTTFSGTSLTANNASYLGGVAAASYVNTIGNYTLSGNNTLTPATTGGIPLNIRGVSGGTANLFQVGNNTTAAQFAVNSIGYAIGNGAGLTSISSGVVANAGIVANSTGVWAPGAGSKSFTILSPIAGDIFVLFYTNVAITVANIITSVTNTAATGWCNTCFYFAANLVASGTSILSSNTANNTLGLFTTSFGTAAVTAGSFVWCNVVALSNATSFSATILFH